MSGPPLPSTLDQAAFAPGWRMSAPGGHLWSCRDEARERVPCERCGRLAYQAPPCEVRDGAGNLLRVERRVVCAGCLSSDASWNRARGRPRLCACGCGLNAHPSHPYRNGHEPTKREEDPMPELQAIEAIASAQIDEPESGGATTRRVCPCGCGRPVNPGRTYAARGCTARSPETRAKMSAAAKRRSKRVKDPSGGYRLEGGPFIGDQPVPAESNHDNANYWSQQIRAYQLDVSAVELDPQEQAASRAVHWLRRLPTNTAREAAYRLACELGEVACG